jgi:hypothetical protein
MEILVFGAEEEVQKDWFSQSVREMVSSKVRACV